MGCTVEERAYTPMGGQIIAAGRFVRPAGPGSPSRFVELDGEPDLAVHRQAGPVSPSEPFGGSPIASGVAPEIVGGEHRHRHNSRPMVRIDGTMAPVSNHVLTARTHHRRLLVRGPRGGSPLLFLHVAEARSKLALGHRPRGQRGPAELALRRAGPAPRPLRRMGQPDAVHRLRGEASGTFLDGLQRHPPGREPADPEGAPRRHRRLRRPVPLAQVRHRAGQPARPAPLRAARPCTIRLRPVARSVSPHQGRTASTSTCAHAARPTTGAAAARSGWRSAATC